jgi:hypothetical protein
MGNQSDLISVKFGEVERKIMLSRNLTQKLVKMLQDLHDDLEQLGELIYQG